jgi:inner membrane protein
MLSPNHIAGGILFTATFAAIGGQNIFEHPSHLALAVFAALLPDIDNPQAAMGRVFRPVSRWIFVHYGHRTITHSLLALCSSTLAFYWLPTDWTQHVPGLGVLTWHHPPTQFWFWGYLSHLLLDMCTLQGVALFYPFRKNPCVLPGNPAFRMRTGNLKAETLVFCIFLGLGFFLRPLFKNGWWTSYNRFFANLAHLDSEQHKTSDLLRCTYTVQDGSRDRSGEGLVVATAETKAVLLENERFTVLDEHKDVVRQVLPTHTGQAFGFKDTTFAGLPEQTLNDLLAHRYIISADIQSNGAPFESTSTRDPIPWKGTRFKSEYLTGLYVRALYDSTRLDSIFFQESPRLLSLYQEISIERQREAAAREAWQNTLERIRTMRRSAATTADLYAREQITREADALERRTREPDTRQTRIPELLIQIDQVRREDARSLAGKQAAAARKYGPRETLFTGMIRVFWYGKPPP